MVRRSDNQRRGNVARKTVRKVNRNEDDADSSESGGTPRIETGDESSDQETESGGTPRNEHDEGARKTIRAPSTDQGGSSRRKITKPVKNNKAREQIRALKNIRLVDKNYLSIPRAPFFKVIKELLQKFAPNAMGGGTGFKIQRAALDAIQVAAEAYMVNFFEDMNLLTDHAKRKTLMYQDYKTLLRLRCNSGDRVMLELAHKI